jgi:hypothetical protein
MEMHSRTPPDPLPHWPAGTVTIFATAGPEPHAIPVSTALRVSDARILLALGAGRGSLQRLRASPRVALAILCADDVACTAHGVARVAADPLADLEGVVGVVIEVDAVQSHRRATFAIEAPVAWRWTQEQARERDGQVRAALSALAESIT